MTRRGLRLTAGLTALLVASLAHARPGGGSSFSGSSYRPSTSTYRPTPTYRPSSSGSSSSTSSTSYVPSGPPPPPPVKYRRIPADESSTRLVWTPGGPPLFARDSAPTTDAAPLERCDIVFDYNEAKTWSQTIVHALPVFGLLLMFAVLVGVIVRNNTRPRQWTTRTPPPPAAPQRRRLAALRDSDPDFSLVLFDDFLYHLYAVAHAARHTDALATSLRAYLGPNARGALQALGRDPVSAIIVGGTQIQSASHRGGRWHVTVEFTTNYSETAPSGLARGYYSVERWTLSRDERARSRPPERVTSLGCPRCGAPTSSLLGAACSHCGTPVGARDFDWIVESIAVQRSQRAPVLTGTAVEVGTDAPTIHDPGLTAGLTALHTRDPHFTDEAFTARLQHIFKTMHSAWTSLRWHEARPVLSDALHAAQTSWIAAYRAAGLRNVGENTRLTRQEIVACTSDRWYDAITVRVFATGLDYTIRDSDGVVVGGSRSDERAYSEYWTLIRGTGTPRGDTTCPRCGAALALTMAGDCEHCSAHLTTAAFDWVLSRIEQDETYRG